MMDNHVSNPFIAGQGSSEVVAGKVRYEWTGSFKPLHSGAGFLSSIFGNGGINGHGVSNPFIAGQGSSDGSSDEYAYMCALFQTPS